MSRFKELLEANGHCKDVFAFILTRGKRTQVTIRLVPFDIKLEFGLNDFEWFTEQCVSLLKQAKEPRDGTQ